MYSGAIRRALPLILQTWSSALCRCGSYGSTRVAQTASGTLPEGTGHHSARDASRSKDWQADSQKETHSLQENSAMRSDADCTSVQPVRRAQDPAPSRVLIEEIICDIFFGSRHRHGAAVAGRYRRHDIWCKEPRVYDRDTRRVHVSQNENKQQRCGRASGIL